MEKKVTISAVKKVYNVFADEMLRGFFACLKMLQKDAADAAAAKEAEAAAAALKSAADAVKAAKDADAKKAAEAAKKEAQKAAAAAKKAAAEADKRKARSAAEAAALDSLAEVMLRKGFAAADINKEFLQQYLPLRFNAQQQICKVTLVAEAEEAEVRKQYEAQPQFLIERDNHLFVYIPIRLFTANTFLSLFCAAADARKKQLADTRSAAEKEADAAKKAAKYAATLEVWRKRIAEADAKAAAAEAQPQK